ncbi:MAG: hypothetical protein ACTSWN_14120 [Promethearchaeota archaeon]
MKDPIKDAFSMKLARDFLPEAVMEKIFQVKKSVIDQVKPNFQQRQKVTEITKEVIACLKDILDKNGISYDFCEPQGSTGIKQTQLAGNSDVDLFIGLNPSLIEKYSALEEKEKKIQIKNLFKIYIRDLLATSLKKQISPEKIIFSYAEHPYLTIKFKGIKFDIVFCFNITSNYIHEHGLITAMDRTPLHSVFVRDNLSPEQKDEVRLMKAFLKAQHVYGDRSAPGKMGFVGYCIEIMIYFFHSIENLMVNFPKLESQPLDIFKRPKDVLLKNPRYSNDVLIIIDPTDMNRNVGSSTSERAYRYANHVISKFLENPTPRYFQVQPIPAPKNKDYRYYSIIFSNSGTLHYTIVRDKLYKLGSTTIKAINRENHRDKKFGNVYFEVIFSNDDKKAAMAFFAEKPNIPGTYLRRGPSINSPKKNIYKFLKKHPDAKINDDGYYYVKIKRKHSRFTKAIVEIIKEKLNIDGLTPICRENGKIAIEDCPTEEIGLQAIHVLKNMVIPFIKNKNFKR